MTFIIILLIILLTISISNNYLLYQRKAVIGNCPKAIINDINLPENTAYKNVTFFYKKKPYNMCHKNDLKNNIDCKLQKRYEGEMFIENILSNIKNKHSNRIYYLVNKKNSSTINFSDQNILDIKYLPN